jgi:hypothetical protein
MGQDIVRRQVGQGLENNPFDHFKNSVFRHHHFTVFDSDVAGPYRRGYEPSRVNPFALKDKDEGRYRSPRVLRR